MAKEKWDTDWLIFSRKTRRGALFLLVLFFIIAISPRIYKVLFVSNEVDSLTYKPIKEASFVDVQQVNSKQESEQTTKNSPHFPKDKSDPNTFSKSEWMAIGLSEKQAESVMKYKMSIDGFKSFDDLENVYVFNDEIVSLLKRNVKFEEKNEHKDLVLNDTVVKENNEPKKETNENTSVYEINSVTKEELLSIKGIGPFFAEKIIEKRQAIGGYVALDQLLSIYNFDEDKLLEVRPYLTVNKENIKKLNLNLITVNQLKKHPEINWDTAKSIIDLRTELGAFTSLDQLLLSVYIDSDKYRKIAPYFTLE